MSDSKDFTVTYTAVSNPFADLPDIGSPGVDGPTVMPEDPYAYVVAAFQAPPSPDYMSESYPERRMMMEDPEGGPNRLSKADGRDEGDDEDSHPMMTEMRMLK
ncbi:hypothetical protein Tco_0344520 [Tanacetum coccineum]